MTLIDMAKKNYDRGLWTVEMLEALVTKGKLTAEQCRGITDEASSAVTM